MEVHAHSHTPRKKWTHYFWEFLMLFLAVFCGFLAENFREHQLEHKRERQYMASMASELNYDLGQYEKVLKKISVLTPALDSFYNNIKNAEYFQYRLEPRWNTVINNTTAPYFPSMPTLQQLKNSGNLRLIKDHEVERSIMIYEAFIEGHLRKNGDDVNQAAHKVYEFEDRFCDYTDFNRVTTENLNNKKTQNRDNALPFEMPLLIKDPLQLNQFANSIVNYRAFLYGYYTNILTAKEKTTALLELINKEYHFK
ncbi:MAG: hypothetical protein ABIT05_08470 [Chitinophagaceae bacterium]